ncbi:RNase adapter RapZ [Stenotrophobium rhamnosiphilum]|uniref:RNase adapter RapZ n=1 Tax=Stenotrophobium rhamnosiphilum TaxID=2029166 RepID=A0A2T5MBU5_9GAMM|nr:RNase adapter RapZ [Stenotrophobium rhamnosiphilum]PTU30046.1 RNase adapter RapZ [Stenotrophobium rhamnosiphilum]
MQLVIISGLSGAGKTVALKQYEDLGYYCIDNLPLALVANMTERTLHTMEKRYELLAVGIDARESPGEIALFPKYLDSLRERDVDIRVVFLNADEQVLLHRYSDTRRKHPLSDDKTSLLEAIRKEVKLLEPISNAADSIIDTSRLNLHELREKVLEQSHGGGAGKLSVQLMSFGFKHGAPAEADFVFDVRCLPNPHWEPTLRSMTGRDEAVAKWLEQHPQVQKMTSDIRSFLESWMPEYQKQDRAYLTIAIGCTGGKHRSVYLVEKLAKHFGKRFDHIIIKHRESWENQGLRDAEEKK